MKKPILVVMAAGMGSRYGGLKQIAPVDAQGHILTDYSLFDAHRAGFERAVFIIRKSLEKDFREVIGDRLEKHMEVRYAFQELHMLPGGYNLPDGREKPWGTAHAVLCARDVIDADFAVINADDFYGYGAYKTAYDFLTARTPDRPQNHAMIGYQLGKTVTEHGSVARGVCLAKNGQLVDIVERTHIEARPGGAAFTEDGTNFTFLPPETLVSMNFFAFRHGMLDAIDGQFTTFLDANVPKNPLKCEFLLPTVANTLLHAGKIAISVLPTDEKWYGVTYADDMPAVQAALAALRAEGKYPEVLWH